MKIEIKTFHDEYMRKMSEESFVFEIASSPNFRDAKHFKEFFSGKKYYALDAVSKYKPDIVGDVLRLPFKNDIVPSLICRAVLEHTKELQKAVKEMHRVLKQNGRIFCYALFICPYHVEKESPKPFLDYYRFSKDAITHMFRDFSDVKIVEEKGHIETLSWYTPLYKIKIWIKIAKFLDRFIRSNTTSGYLFMGSNEAM